MSGVPKLLNEDGAASMATMLMVVHHGFRRDIRRFANALDQPGRRSPERASALGTEWKFYRAALHEHHHGEDAGVFPGVLAQRPDLASTVERLMEQHRQIDPLMERGDRAFEEASFGPEASAVVHELAELLEPHLALEESDIVPLLRPLHEFPPPQNAEEASFFAIGIAWASAGVAPDVLEQLMKLLPAQLVQRLPAAQEEYRARSVAVWGALAPGAARTPMPDP